MDKVFDKADEIVKNIFRNWPQVETITAKVIVEVLDGLFSPKQIAKQFVLATAIQTGLMCARGLIKVFNSLVKNFTVHGQKRRKIEDRMNKAKTYEEYINAAQDLDELEGLDKWRQDQQSTLFNADVLKKRIHDVQQMIDHGDIFDMMFRLRSGLARDQYGTLHPALFNRAHAGTKAVIEEYNETISEALNLICDNNDDEDIPSDAKLAFFNETRHAYGRTALMLSGGAALGFYHMGLVKALFKEGLLPRIVSGASAGAIMASVICTCTDEELSYLVDSDPNDTGFRLDFFRFNWENQKPNAKMQFQYLLPQSLRWISDGLLSTIFRGESIMKMDTEHLKAVAIHNIGKCTFQEAFDRTGRMLNITVAPVNNYDPPRLLNYLTAPHVCVWSAAVASCCIPGVFDTVDLLVKEPNGEYRREHEWTMTGTKGMSESSSTGSFSSGIMKSAHTYTDGSVEADLPMQQLAELFNVNHFIISQVNPHSALLSTLSLQASNEANPIYGTIVGYLRFLKAQCRDWFKNFVDLVVYNSNAPAWSSKRGFAQLVTQEYEGRDHDVTIMPWKGHLNAWSAFTNIIFNPTSEEYNDMNHVAAKNTWPKIPRIRAQCRVERVLDACVHRLRQRVHCENTIKSLQLAVGSSALGSSIPVDDTPPVVGETMGMSRIPSFYTTKDMVHLSGLSISDPLPQVSPQQINTTMDSQLSEEEIKALLTDAVVGESVPLSVHEQGGVDYYGDDNSIGDFAPVKFRKTMSSRSHEGRLGRNKEFGGISGSGSGGKLHKTTSMANFYYKKSKSEELLANAANANGPANDEFPSMDPNLHGNPNLTSYTALRTPNKK